MPCFSYPAQHSRKPIPYPRCICRVGFTVVELLAVLVVLAILSGLLYPMLITSKSQSKRISCISRLAQYSKALAVYGADHDDTCVPTWKDIVPVVLPTSTPCWIHSLYPYSRSLEGCPELQRIDDVAPGTRTGYALNGEWMQPLDSSQKSFLPRKLDSADYPSTTITILDAPLGCIALVDARKNAYVSFGKYALTSRERQLPDYTDVTRHLGFVNTAFLDGHARAIRLESLKFVNDGSQPSFALGSPRRGVLSSQ